MNKIVLTGRISQKNEVRYTASGQATCNFNIACKRDYQNQQGEQETDFFPCVCWNGQCDFLQKYCEVGDLIAIGGKIQKREWFDQSNQKHSITEVVVNKLELLAKKNPQPQQSQDAQVQGQMYQQPMAQPQQYANVQQPQYQQTQVQNQPNNMQPQYQQPIPNNYQQQPQQPIPQNASYGQAIPQSVNYQNPVHNQGQPMAQPQVQGQPYGQPIQVPQFTVQISDDDLPF